ncbi:MAG TPA: peptidylprolyl isomerase [Burkholderiales bacterium]|nr:peptidylprolyl isomerase [Burkholderiales bacterium]
MNTRIVAAAMLAAPLLAFAQGSAKDGTKDAARKPAAAQAPVATVNGVAVPRSRMEFLMQQQKARGAQDNEQMRAMVREELVNREVVQQEAQRSGVARSPEVQAQVDLARQEIIVGAYIRDWVRKHPVTDAEVQKEYERAKQQTGDKEYRARHILVETEGEAQGLIAELQKGAKFDELAEKHSKDSGTKERGGDLDWSLPSAYERQFSEAMTKLEKGRVTDAPVRTRYGYHVIRLDDVRPMNFPPLADLRPRIQQQLVQNRVQELIQGLRAKAKIE